MLCSSVTLGVASSIVNDIIMRTGAVRAASAVGARYSARLHNENDVTMTITGLWRYGDWRHVAMGCTTLVIMESQMTLADTFHVIT